LRELVPPYWKIRSRTPVAKKETPPADEASPLTFEEALAKLQTLVHSLEEGDVGLDEALASYEEGVKLLRHCHRLLESAERRIELLSGIDAEGMPIAMPLDDTALSLEEKSQRRGRRRSAPESSTPSDGGSTGREEGDIDVPGSLF
jgi:exodeoxyribonuclease VII small subunit